jgi:endonuclease III
MATRSRIKLRRIVALLRKEYGPAAPPPVSTAFELVLWEKVAYLATDERRALAFKALRKRVGTTPQAIIDADPTLLREIAAIGGGIEIEARARRMQDAAAFVLDELGGSLDAVLTRPPRDAMGALQQIYGIGEPGAERILLLMRAQKVLPLDSNGARTLCRIGYGSDNKNYATMYKSVRAATAPELVADFDWLIDAHLLTRRHGQEVCKTTSPHCEVCVLNAECNYARARSHV